MWKILTRFFRDYAGWKPGRTMATLFILLVIVLLIGFFVPPYRINSPMSTVVLDRNGQLIGAQVAADGQWRFPSQPDVPEKFKTCLLQFEDSYFYKHPGFNPLSLVRAAYQNITEGKIVSGGSTITMQLVRISRGNKPRSVKQKLIEICLSVYSEIRFTKNHNLRQYASAAPFGGNIVGLEAASWRYFGRSPENLSWAEAACLAVLPNSPALIHPGRNRTALKEKRNRLLSKLLKNGLIDKTTWELAILEPVPEKPQLLPNIAPHLVSYLTKVSPGQLIVSTIDETIQKNLCQIIVKHHEKLVGNGIHNAAVLILKTVSGEVVAYSGNTLPAFEGDHANMVDIIRRPRSSGSLLKPLLFAAMLSEGEILPNTLVADIPTTISGYTPKNFSVTYDGAVPAREALIRSLNIPAVRMLNDFGQPRFYNLLKKAGFTTLGKPAEHYGLSLILGGAEITLWDICAVYRAMAVKLLQYENIRQVAHQPFCRPSLLLNDTLQKSFDRNYPDEGAIFLTLEAMRTISRPNSETGWEAFTGSHPVAWKTGTSFGFRDGWAVGITPEYVVGVWTGNADGEGRPGLTGLQTAAPMMFDAFNMLPVSGKWFKMPYDKMEQITVCRQSGMRNNSYCTDIDTIWVNKAALNTPACSYHKLIHLDAEEKFRVNTDCYPSANIHSLSWFALPPAMAWYYKFRDPFYRSLPPWMPGCNFLSENPMQMIWPDQPDKIFIPYELDGKPGKVLFEIAHQQPEAKVFWYIDNDFTGETQLIHKMEFRPEPGKHQLVLMDEEGNILNQDFEIVER